MSSWEGNERRRRNGKAKGKKAPWYAEGNVTMPSRTCKLSTAHERPGWTRDILAAQVSQTAFSEPHAGKNYGFVQERSKQEFGGYREVERNPRVQE